MRAALMAGAWLYAAAIVFLSLTPRPPQLEVEHGDKLGHLLSYGLLMFWFCCLYRDRYTRLAYCVGWVVMGIALEFAQRATGHRSFEVEDMFANAAGVLIGWLATKLLPERVDVTAQVTNHD